MPSFLVALSVDRRDCLVVGGDREAHEKSRRLRAAGASLRVLCPDAPLPEFVAWMDAERVPYALRPFDERDLTPAPFVLISCVQDAALSARLRALAAGRGSLLCCVDQPACSDFANVATGDAGTVTVGLASGGTAPGLLKRLRDGLLAGMGDDFAEFTRYLAALRAAAPRASRRATLDAALEGLRVELEIALPEGWRARWERLRAV